jgi:hypothetical protein
VRSRRSLVFLIIAVVLAAGAAAPFSPRVYWGARVSWAARGLESPNEDERWKARLALLQMPSEQVERWLPRIVANVAIDHARRGGVLCLKQRGGKYEEVLTGQPFKGNVNGFLSREYAEETEFEVRDLLRGFGRGREKLYSLRLRHDSSGYLYEQVGPLDPEGETLRLLKERLR